MRLVALPALALVACTLPAPGSTMTGGDDDDTGEGSGSSVTSRCIADEEAVTCSSQTMQVGGRTVRYEVPVGDAPTAGWPVVLFFQGSFVPGDRAFSATKDAQFAQYQLTSTIKTLLDRGYAVIAPNALGDGSLYWQSNVPPYASSWNGCADDQFIDALFAAMASDSFGPLDPTRRYAMGISSGGFMTSRMAVSYAGQFRALAIASASYATCGKTCSVPPLPADHPPTLFLHGESDVVVPVSSMTPYREALGSKADAIVDATAGHEWLAGAVQAVPAWFDTH